MYQFVRASLTKRGKNNLHEPTDVSQMLMTVFAKSFSGGYLVFTHNTIVGEIFVDYIALLSTPNLPFHNVTFTTWLQSLGNKALPHLGTEPEDEPQLVRKTVKVLNAVQAGFQIHRSHPIFGLEPTPLLEERTDAVLTHKSVDIGDTNNTAIIVNGLHHISATTPQGIRVLDASVSLSLCGRNEVGVLDFTELGGCEHYPIREENLILSEEGTPVSLFLGVKLNRDLRNKSVFITIAGVPQINNEVFDVLGAEQGVLSLHLNRIDLAKLIFGVRGLIDLDSLGISVSDDLVGAVNRDELYSDAVLLKLLALSQSFVTVVNSPGLYTRKHIVRTFTTPGFYEIPYATNHSLINGYGHFPVFWGVHYTEGRVGVKTYPYVYNNGYRYETTNDSSVVINETVDFGRRLNDEMALLEIGCETRV